MAHFLRVFSKASLRVPLHRLEGRLRSEGLYAQFKAPGTNLGDWDQLVVLDGRNRELALLDRRTAATGTPIRAQIDRLIAGTRSLRPRSGGQWLARYLKSVKTIYALQVMSTSMGEEGWRIVTEIQREIFETAGGVRQEDGTGFTNDLGFGIVWQFPEGASGMWPFAVRHLGRWTAFEMDLASASHRQAFLAGKVPAGARPL